MHPSQLMQSLCHKSWRTCVPCGSLCGSKLHHPTPDWCPSVTPIRRALITASTVSTVTFWSHQSGYLQQLAEATPALAPGPYPLAPSPLHPAPCPAPAPWPPPPAPWPLPLAPGPCPWPLAPAPAPCPCPLPCWSSEVLGGEEAGEGAGGVREEQEERGPEQEGGEEHAPLADSSTSSAQGSAGPLRKRAPRNPT